MRVLMLNGSLRRGSFNGLLLEAAAASLPPGVHVARWAAIAELAAYNEDVEGAGLPPAVLDWHDVLRTADALLVATPEYNGSVPGALKNAIDWASRPRGIAPLRGLPVAVVGASPTPHGARWAVSDLRRILGIAGADVVEPDLCIGRVYTRLVDGHLDDGASADVAAVGAALLAKADATDGRLAG